GFPARSSYECLITVDLACEAHLARDAEQVSKQENQDGDEGLRPFRTGFGHDTQRILGRVGLPPKGASDRQDRDLDDEDELECRCKRRRKRATGEIAGYELLVVGSIAKTVPVYAHPEREVNGPERTPQRQN